MNDLQKKFRDAKASVKNCIVGRDEEIDLIFLALVMKEHLLLIGPPGTGKSMLCNQVANVFGGTTFSILANKYTEPDEVFGPISFKAMEQDKRIRKTAGFMPEADLVFIDEIWKASSSILNAMLTIMNERKFKQDSQWVDANVKTIIGASNEYPIGRGYEGLWAAYDRFLLRKHVSELSFDDRMEMAFKKSFGKAGKFLNVNDLDQAGKEMHAIKIPKKIRETFEKLMVDIDQITTCMTDRRTRKAVMAIKANAWLHGRNAVILRDLSCLSHICWSDPNKERQPVHDLVLETVDKERIEAEKIQHEVDELIAPYKAVGFNVELTDAVVSDIRKMQDCASRAGVLGELGHPILEQLNDAIVKMSKNIIDTPVEV